MEQAYTPEAIAGREKRRTSEDGRRKFLAAVSVIAVVSIFVFTAGIFVMAVDRALFPPAPSDTVTAAPARPVAGPVVVSTGARVCNSEALFEQSIDAALANPDAPLITGCWRAGAPMPAVVVASGARESLVLVDIEGVGQMWMQRDALQRPQQS